MPLHNVINQKAYRCNVWQITEDITHLQKLSNATPPASMTVESRKKERLACFALLQAEGLDPRQLHHLANGKPYIEESSTEISLSHTIGWAALLTSEQKGVGIDIERISSRVWNVKDRFIHSEEWQDIQHSGQETHTELTLYWSAKEALFKACQASDVHFKTELRLYKSKATEARKGSFTGVFTRTSEQFHVDYWIEEAFVLTCCFLTESK